MSVIVSPLAGTTLNTASSFLKAEVYNLGMFSTTDLVLTSERTIAVTFTTTARKCAGVILALESSATTLDKSVKVQLQKKVTGTWTDVTIANSFAVDAFQTLSASTIYNSSAYKYNSIIQAFAWAGMTIDDSADTWRFSITQTGGTTGNWSLRTSNATVPFYCEISDIAASATDDDTLICYGPVIVDKTFTAKAILGTGETVYGAAIIICKSSAALTPTSYNESLSWVKVPSASYTLTVNGGVIMGCYSGFRAGREDATITVTIADPAVVTYTSHGLTIGDPVRLKTTGALPTGITAGTIYYIRSVDCATPANEFHLYDTYAHAVDTGATTGRIVSSGTQSGVQRVQWRIPYAQIGIMSFIAPTVGTFSGFCDCEGYANVNNSNRMSIFMYGEIPTIERTTFSGTISATNTSLTTADSTGWLSGDTFAIGKVTTRGAGDPTVYTCDGDASGTTINFTPAIPASMGRTTGGRVFRFNGYGFKLTGPTSTSTFRISLRLPSNLTFSGIQIAYIGVSSRHTYGAAIPSDDTDRMSQWLTEHCSFYTNIAGVYFVDGAYTYSPEKGALVSYCNYNNMVPGYFNYSVGNSGVATLDNNWIINTPGLSGFNILTNQVCTNNVCENSSTVMAALSGPGYTFTNNKFWGNSLTAGANGTVNINAASISILWQDNTYNNCVTPICVLGPAFNVSVYNDSFGDETANDQSIQFYKPVYRINFDYIYGDLAISLASQKLSQTGSWLRFKRFNRTTDDYRAYYKQGRFVNPSQGATIRQISNMTTESLTNNIYISTGDISGFKVGISITGQIDNAAYYAVTYTLPIVRATYDLTTTTSDSMLGNTDAQSFLLVFSPTTDYNDIILSLVTNTNAADANAGVTFSNCNVKIRKYAFTFSAYSIIIKETTDAYLASLVAPSANSYITEAVKATVDAYTGITINHSTQTLTIDDAHTLNEVYDFTQSDLTADANMGYSEWFTTIDGVNYESTYDIVVDGCALTGGGTVDVGANTFTKSNGGTYDGIIITSTDRTVHVNLLGVVDDSLYEVYEADEDIVMSGTASGTLDATYTKTDDVAVTCVVRKFGYLEWRGTGTISDTGLTFNVSQVVDPNTASYTAGIADDFTIDTDAFTITHTAGTTIYTTKELYNWTMDYFADISPDRLQLLLPMSAQTPFDFSVINSYTIPDASHAYIKSGSITEAAGDTLWANVYTVGTIASGNLYIYQDGSEYTKYWGTGNIDVLLKVKAAGALIDSGYVTIFTREYGYLYDHYLVDLSNGGRTAVSVSNPADGNNATAHATIEAWGITIVTEDAPYSKDIDDGEGACEYSAVVDGDGHSIQDIYEWLKFTAEEGQAGEAYTRANAAYAEVKTAPYGTFAGGIFFGARGIWVENVATADALNYVLIDNAGATHQVAAPPVSMTVTNIVAGSRLQLYNIDTDEEIFNDIVAGTSHSEEYTWSEDQDIRIRLAHVDGTTAYAWYETQGTASSTGMSVRADQSLDTVYNSLAIDGSGVTECSITGAVLTVEIDDGDNATTWGRIYAFCCYWLFTEGGMRDQDLYMAATDSVHYVLSGGLQIKNMDEVNPLVITGGFAVDDEGSAVDIMDLTGGMIFTASTEVVPFTYSTGSGLSTEEHDAIIEIQSDVNAMDTSNLLTTGKFLALK